MNHDGEGGLLMHRPRWIALPTVFTTAVIIALSGCGPLGAAGAASFPGNDVVTPAQAQTLVKPLVQRFEEASANSDSGALNAVATPPLLQEELGGIQNDAPTPTPPRPHETYTIAATVAVPHQKSFPAVFGAFATVSTADFSPTVVYVEVVRASATVKWLIDRVVVLEPNQPVPTLATDAAGFAYVVAPPLLASSSGHTIDDVSLGWVNDFNAVAQTGRLTTSVYAPTYGVTGHAYSEYLAQRPPSEQGTGLAISASSATQPPGSAFATTDGGALVPFVAEVTFTYSVLPDYTTTQNANKQDYGGLVPPGTYKTVEIVGHAEVLSYAPPRALASKLTALGIREQPVSGSGS